MDLSVRSLVKGKYWDFSLLAILLILLTYQNLAFYVRFDLNFILLILVLPFVIRKQSHSRSLRYGFIAIGLLILYPFLKLSSIYFFAFICTLFFLYESQFRKLNTIPLFLVIIVSPVAIFLSEVVGFEIRLWLTKIAASLLDLFRNDISYFGNIIIINKQEFHVDAECMGLKMVLLALFIGLVFISFHQQRKRKDFSFFSIIITLLVSYLLVILSNLIRIILITLFQSLPGTFSHEIIGILCFCFYVIIPLWFFIKILPNRLRDSSEIEIIRKINKAYYAILLAILFLLFGVFRFTDIGSKEFEEFNSSSLNIEDIKEFQCSTEQHGVLKLTNDKLLVYLKPPTRFYSADHTPLICWKGSGYKINKEEMLNIGDMRVYYSELKQGQDILYSTWWYDSGDDKTISQFRWRTNNLIHGSDYYLVNVVSYNKNILLEETEKLLNTSIFNL
jgi:exosortase N